MASSAVQKDRQSSSAARPVAESRKEVLEFRGKMQACRQEARELSRRHGLAGSGDSAGRIDEAFGEIDSGLTEYLDNDLGR